MWNDKINYEIEGTDGTRITCVLLSDLQKMVKRLEKDFQNEDSTKVLLPFEFIIGSLFPAAYENIRNFASSQYIEGYNAGKEGKEL